MRFGPPPALHSSLLHTGAGPSNGGGSALLPPSVAPVLDVQTMVGSSVASLTWTASNRTGSAGFTYRIDAKINEDAYEEVATTTSLTYNDTRGNPPATGETYTYRITPLNDYGEGPSSNEAGVVLPGESLSAVILNNGANILLNATGTLLIN